MSLGIANATFLAATYRASGVALALPFFFLFLVAPIPNATAQARLGKAGQQPVPDSAAIANMENAIAVATSGVWNMDGEFKGSRGEYYKLTGYFAYVAATSTSHDGGERAVIAMYLERMTGGSATWMSARLNCWLARNPLEVRCLAVEGAATLLDCNIVFRTIPLRGQKAEADISEPEEKDAEKRFQSRSVSRGWFTLIPVDP